MKFIEPLPKQLNKDHDAEIKQNREDPYVVAKVKRDSIKTISISLAIISFLVVFGLILLFLILLAFFNN